MAVIAFSGLATSGALGGALATTFGIAVAGAVGSYIDQALIFPAIFGQDQNLEGPKLDDLQVSLASEGSPSMFAIGEAVPVSGAVIWTAPIFTESSATTSQGGKGMGGGGGGSSTTYSYSISVAIRSCETDDLPGAKIQRVLKIWANDKVIYDYNAGATDVEREDTRYESIAFYDGSQVVNDPTIESINGVPETIPYKGSAYIVLEELQLVDFGNRLPNFKVLVEATATGQTVSDAISRLCLRAGLVASDIDVTGVTSTTLGIVSSGDQATAQVLESMMVGYDLVVYESNGRIVFQDRAAQSQGFVDETDLAAYEIGEQAGTRPFKIMRKQFTTRKLPKRLTVQFTDPDCEYERSTRTATKTNTSNSELRRVELPLTLTEAQASEIALRMLWIQWGVRDAVDFTLPPSYISIDAGDLITAVDDGETEIIRIISVQRGNNLMVVCRGVIEEPDIYDQNAISSGRTCISPDDVAAIQDGQAMLIVTDHQLGLPGVDTPGAPNNNGRGAFVAFSGVKNTSKTGADRTGFTYEASEVAGDYNWTSLQSDEAIMGFISVELAAPFTGTETGEFFTGQEFEITVFGDTWTPNLSATMEDILAGDNQIVIQDENGSPELVSFFTVVANGQDGQGRRRYVCSDLIRGQRATGKNAQVWPINTGWVLASEFTYNSFSPSSRGRTVSNRFLVDLNVWFLHDESYWKTDTRLSPTSVLTGTRQDWTGGARKLFPPQNIRCQWDAAGNCTLMWRRRSWSETIGVTNKGSHPLPSDPEFYWFDIDIYDPTGTTIDRTIQFRDSLPDISRNDFALLNSSINRTYSGLTSTVYTAAMQATDGYSGGVAAIVANGIKADIYPVDRSSVRGFPVEVVFKNGMVL